MINAYAAVATFVAFAQERLRRDEKGATAVEYGLMVGLIAVAIIIAVTALGGGLSDLFSDVEGKLPAVEGGTAPAAGSGS